jgi:hypothetical protein
MDGASGQYLRALGFTVYHENEDFFKIDQVGAQQRGDVVVSNPPFSRKEEVLRRLKDLGMPFVLILEDNVQATEYYHNIFGTDRPNVLSPQKRFGFVNEEGVQKGSAMVVSKYYFYKVPLPPDAQPKCVEREKKAAPKPAEPMVEAEPAAGGDAGAGSGGGSSAAATQAMPPPAPQSPAPAPTPAAAQSPVEQQMAQMMAMMQTMNQRLASAEDRAKAAEAERDQAKEDLKVSHEREEAGTGQKGENKKKSRSS